MTAERGGPGERPSCGGGPRPAAAGLVTATLAVVVGFCIASGIWWSLGGRSRADMREVSRQTRDELEPAFERYLRDGPEATGRLTVLGADLRVDLIHGERTAYFGVIPSDGPVPTWPEGVWVTDVGRYAIYSYKYGYLLAVLDPKVALDIFGGTTDARNRDLRPK